MTTVKQLIAGTMTAVGRADAASAYADDSADAEQRELAVNLLYCFNAVADQLVRHYFPVTAEEKVYAKNGAVLYSEFSRPVLRVYTVRDRSGRAVKYSALPDRILTDVSPVTVKYAALHSVCGENDESGLDARMSDELIIYGMASEYCLINGECALADEWERRYRGEIELALADLPRWGYMPPRRWV